MDPDEIANCRFRRLRRDLLGLPSSTVLKAAESNQGTATHDKGSRIADRYRTEREVDPRSSSGEIIRPSVVGVTRVENNISNRHDCTRTFENRRNFLDRESIDEVISKFFDFRGKGLDPITRIAFFLCGRSLFPVIVAQRFEP